MRGLIEGLSIATSLLLRYGALKYISITVYMCTDTYTLIVKQILRDVSRIQIIKSLTLNC